MSIKPFSIILFEAGGLGNQIFQYIVIRSLFPLSPIYTVGMDKLFLCFELQNTQRTPKLWSFFWKKLKKHNLIYFFLRLGLVSYLRETQSNNTYSLELIRYHFFNWLVSQECRFQNYEYINDNICNQLFIRNEYRQRARSRMAQFRNHHPVFFVHIRQNDYLELGWDLSQDWYRSQIERVLHQYPNTSFVLLSDSPHIANSWFAHEPYINKAREENEFTDLAIMELCDGGILSASTYSFWGSYFSHRNHRDGLYIAPKYWLGHKSKSWYPPKIMAPWIKYYD